MSVLGTTGFILELAYAGIALATGIFVLAIAPGKKTNQALGWLLLVDGLTLGGLTASMRYWDGVGPAINAAADTVTDLGFTIVPVLYLLFIGRAMQGSVAKFFSRPLVLSIVAVVLIAHWVGLQLQVVEEQDLLSGFVKVGGLAGSGLVGIVAAIQNRRHAQGPEAHRRATAYLWAFVARDVGYVGGYGGGFILSFWFDASPSSFLWQVLVVYLQVFWLLFIFLLLYGILTGQIADLDGKFRFGITQTLTAGAIAALFVIITESAEQLFNAENNGLAIAVAVALAFVFKPLQSVAERAARRILPTPAVSSVQYEAAVARALQDGKITKAEQRMLDDLLARLG